MMSEVETCVATFEFYREKFLKVMPKIPKNDDWRVNLVKMSPPKTMQDLSAALWDLVETVEDGHVSVVVDKSGFGRKLRYVEDGYSSIRIDGDRVYLRIYSFDEPGVVETLCEAIRGAAPHSTFTIDITNNHGGLQEYVGMYIHAMCDKADHVHVLIDGCGSASLLFLDRLMILDMVRQITLTASGVSDSDTRLHNSEPFSRGPFTLGIPTASGTPVTRAMVGREDGYWYEGDAHGKLVLRGPDEEWRAFCPLLG